MDERAEVEAMVRAGDILAGKYRVERVLGAGGMGVVVAARHIELQELRALKFMLPDMLRDAESVERFVREARAAARLKSQHVAKVFDVGKLDTGSPYIVMEYLEGTDLKTLATQRGALPVREAVNYMLQACEAVGEAHEMGIVHRDLKPANLFLTKGVGGAPCVKVLDFGIAKLSPDGSPGADIEITNTQVILGSPLYMSPEQMQSLRRADARSDIWSLGIILYKLVSGSLPFRGESVASIFAAVLSSTPSPPSTYNAALPASLDAVILRCLEKDPARRFQSITELISALLPFGVDAVPSSTPSLPETYLSITATKLSAQPGVPIAPSSAPSISERFLATTSTQPLSQPSSAPHSAPHSAPAAPHSAPAAPHSSPHSAPHSAPAAPPYSAPPSLQSPLLEAPPLGGTTSRTDTAWAQTGRGPPPSRPRISVVVATAIGSALVSAIVVIVVVSRVMGSAPASPPGDAPSAVPQAIEPSTVSPPPIAAPTFSSVPTSSTAKTGDTGAAPSSGSPNATARAQSGAAKAGAPVAPAPTSTAKAPSKSSTTKSAPPKSDPFGGGRF
jgi:eukaryotic-like serine/threonine-protein kinase